MSGNESCRIRIAHRDDYGTVAEIMFESVRHGASAYSESQRIAWMPDVPSGSKWLERLESQTVYVAQQDNNLAGFMSCDQTGYIDLAFIRPKWQGTGTFRRLYSAIEEWAREQKLVRLWVHASLNASGAFAAMGFRTLSEETVEIRGQELNRCVMEKLL